MTNRSAIQSKFTVVAALAVALMLALIFTSFKSMAAEENGSLEITYLQSEQVFPGNSQIPEDIYAEMRLTAPAGYSFVFETVEEKTVFYNTGERTASVTFRMVKDQSDCQTGVRAERTEELSEPNIFKLNEFNIHARDSAFIDAGLVDETGSSLTIGYHRLSVWSAIGRYVCAAVEVKSDSSPEGVTMYSHLVSDKRITLDDIVTPIIASEEEFSIITKPDSPSSLEYILLPVDMSKIELYVGIHHLQYLPDNTDYIDNAADYWRYKLVADRSECPQADSVTEQRSGFSSFPEVAAWGQPQSNISPVKHLEITLAESPADSKGKHLCLETKLKSVPAEYSYYSGVAAIEWSTGQTPDTPFSGWDQLTREEKLTFNPYECADVEQIDESNGQCLDGSGLLTATYEDEDDGSANGDSDTLDKTSSNNIAALIMGGIILAVIIGSGLLFIRKGKSKKTD